MALDDEPHLAPKKTTVGSESIEEHSLADRIKYEQHVAANAAASATPQKRKLGLPIFRTRVRHHRP